MKKKGRNRWVNLALTSKQKKLMKRHGTPAEFAKACYECVPGFISMDEAAVAIAGYQRDWDKTSK